MERSNSLNRLLKPRVLKREFKARVLSSSTFIEEWEERFGRKWGEIPKFDRTRWFESVWKKTKTAIETRKKKHVFTFLRDSLVILNACWIGDSIVLKFVMKFFLETKRKSVLKFEHTLGDKLLVKHNRTRSVGISKWETDVAKGRDWRRKTSGNEKKNEEIRWFFENRKRCERARVAKSWGNGMWRKQGSKQGEGEWKRGIARWIDKQTGE